MQPEKLKCNSCSSTFSTRFNLYKHVRNFHSIGHSERPLRRRSCENKNIICATCRKAFTRKSNLLYHISYFHSQQLSKNWRTERKRNAAGRENNFVCSVCQSTFSKKYNLRKHERKIHNVIELKLKKETDCTECGRTFSKTLYLKTHRERWHNDTSNHGGLSSHAILYKKSSALQCPECKQKFDQKKTLLEHFCEIHKISLRNEFLTFENEIEFKNWKFKEEEKCKCSYVVRQSSSQGKYKRVILKCCRSGHYECKIKQRKRCLKRAGYKKINGYCPAEIIIKIVKETGIVEVRYQPVHVGHSGELRYMKLNESDRTNIIKALAANVPPKLLLKKYQADASVRREERRRVHLLNMDDIRNIGNTAGVYDTSKSRSNNEISVQEWIDMHRNSVLYCKWEGNTDPKYSFLNEEDFVLIIMTPVQIEKLKKFGSKTLYMDSLHGHSNHDFLLSTLVVLDETNSAYPTAFMFSNETVERFYQVFHDCISERVPHLKTSILMTGISECFYNIWLMKIEEPLEVRLYGTWHVTKAWWKNLEIVEEPEKQRYIKKRLRSLLYTTEEDTFLTMLNEFMEPNQGIDAFQKYFYDEYFIKRPPELWAYCYQMFIGKNAHKSLEFFHRKIKYDILGGTTKRKLNKTLLALDVYLHGKERTDVLKEEGCSPISYRERMLRKRHKEIKNCTFENIVCVDENSSWFLTSQTPSDNKGINTVYLVEKVPATCLGDCSLKCMDCDTCLHEFKCSCVDHSVKGNMCKHVHLVCQYIKSNPVTKNESQLNEVIFEVAPLNEDTDNRDMFIQNSNVHELYYIA